jgi:uncharacterized protein (DUF2062 family)
MRHDREKGVDGNESRLKRIRLLKKILRYIPRKASIHKYPILNKFADSARKRPYLWSFRISEATPALYLGWIVTFMPIPSALQIVVAFFLAMACRANVMILTCLQLLSNPFTFVPMWLLTYNVGSHVTGFFGVKCPNVAEFMKIITANNGQPVHYGELVMRGFATIFFGAIFLGSAVGAICNAIYVYFAKKYARPRQSIHSK